jgi:threonine/homoserine/homoserine lactone efflux protein
MIECITIAVGFAFAAAMQPGPLQAFLFARIMLVGWKRTLPAALAPIISDGPIAILVLLFLHNVAQGFENYLRIAGGIVLIYFAIRAYLEWQREKKENDQVSDSATDSLKQAVIVNLLNPGPYLGWSLILGPLVIREWEHAPINSVSTILTFYLVMTSCLVAWITLMGTTTYLGPKGRRFLVLLSAIILAGLGIFSILSAMYGIL